MVRSQITMSVAMRVFILLLNIKDILNKQIIKNDLIFLNANNKVGDVPNNMFTDNCLKQLIYTFRHLNEKWAIKMIDASSKLPSGLLSGNVVDFGSFEQCLSVQYIIENEKYSGNYCKFQMPAEKLRNLLKFITGQNDSSILSSLTEVDLDINNIMILFAFCLPQSCKAPVLNNLLKANIFDMNVLNCQTKQSIIFNIADIAAITFFLSILSLICFCTVFDYYCQYNKKDTHLLFEAFSLSRNLKKLFGIDHKSNQLKCIHGIKSLSMMWIILGHTYYSSFLSPSINSVDIVKWFQNSTSMFVLGATMAVDTFFMLSGLLTCYIYLSLKENGISFKIYGYYLHRYIRLTPALTAMVIFHSTLIKYVSVGPYWPEVMQVLNVNCMNYWWSALMFIQNYVNPKEMCIIQSWYLSVDMQLFILSPLILIPLGKWPKLAIYSLIFLILMSVIISGMITWKYEISGFIIDAMMNENIISVYYYNTFTRFGPMLIGIILGYIIFNKTKLKKFNLLLENNYFYYIGWFISSNTLALIVFGQNNIQKHDYDPIESSLYLGVHRIAWCIALSWIIYVCTLGFGGIINTFLSMQLFQIISRLTYSMYLTHFSLQWINIGRLRTPIYFDHFQNVYNFCADFLITLILSTILTLTFESPLFTIEKYYLNKKKSDNSNS